MTLRANSFYTTCSFCTAAVCTRFCFCLPVLSGVLSGWDRHSSNVSFEILLLFLQQNVSSSSIISK